MMKMTLAKINRGRGFVFGICGCGGVCGCVWVCVWGVGVGVGVWVCVCVWGVCRGWVGCVWGVGVFRLYLTLVILRVFPKHIFLRGLLQPPSGLSILKVI